MKASEFKKILKPLFEQTVKEVLLKEVVLSNIVAEVARGLNNTILEQRHTSENSALLKSEEDTRQREDLREQQRQERIKKLNESSKFGDVFKGTRQLEDRSHGPLTGIASSDKGVDISAIEKLASGKWKRLM